MRNRLRVAVLIDAWFPFQGGGQEHVRRITNALSKDCRFNIYHASKPSLTARTLWSLLIIPQVIRDHEKRKYDLIHAHAFIAGIPGKILSVILGIPVVYTVHGSHTLDLTDLKRSQPDFPIAVPKWKELLETLLLTKVRYDRQITVAENFLHYKNVNTNIRVISNGVDVREFDRIIVKKKKRFTVMFVGKENQIKGFPFLNEAIERMREKYPRIKLQQILGAVSDRKKLIRAYKSSHLFILPSLAEGQPISLLEAWAAKLPVIVTAVGDNPKMVEDGVNGYLIPPADTNALRRAITRACTNPNLDKLGEEGYNMVKKDYTWRKAAKATLKIYKEVTRATR